MLSPQLFPAMPKAKRKSGISKEELEIQAVLSPSSRSTLSANVSPSQADLSAAPPFFHHIICRMHEGVGDSGDELNDEGD